MHSEEIKYCEEERTKNFKSKNPSMIDSSSLLPDLDKNKTPICLSKK